MQVGIELLPQRLELFHPVLLQHLGKLALGELDAFEQRTGSGVGLLPLLGVECPERASHVVGNGHDVAREVGDAVDAGIGDLAIGPPAQILHFSEHAQELVLVLGGNAGVVVGVDRPGLGSLRRGLPVLGLGARIDGWAGIRIRHHIVPTCD